MVAAGRTPAAVSVAVSRQLFDAAPAVVVAAATDAAGIADGAAQAERLGAPLLLDDGTGSAVRTEIGRLGPRTVVAIGPEVGGRLQGTAAEVVADAGEVADASPVDGLREVAVLVRAGTDAAGKAVGAAATATGKAAGAAVVPVTGPDPRADPDAIDSLAAAKPTHVLAAGAGFGAVDRLRTRLAVAATGVQLPGGGQVVFPGRRLVALYGHPGDGLARRARRAAGGRGHRPGQAARGAVPLAVGRRRWCPPSRSSPPSRPRRRGRTATTRSRHRSPCCGRGWTQAGAAGVYVVLDLQPGRTDFLTQAKRYESLLRLPHVGLALDPEWRLRPGQKHLTQIGSVTAAEVNRSPVAGRPHREEQLPQKLFVLHQFRLAMIGDDQPLQRDRDELALLIHMDGQGPTGSKDATWRAVAARRRRGCRCGWKNFYDEDNPMLTPAQTMTRRPTPVMISYQ